MDFGLARRESPTDAKLTSTGMFVGTPAYTSPEQIRNQPNTVGPPTDVYSLGVILYELLTGRRPFEAEDVMSVLSKVLSEEPPAVHELNSDVGTEISRICMRAMRKDPSKRFATMAEFAQVLTAYLKTTANPSASPAVSRQEPPEAVDEEPVVEPINSQALDLASLDFLQSNATPLQAPSSPLSSPLAYSSAPQQVVTTKRSQVPLIVIGAIGILGVIGAVVVTLMILNSTPREGIVRLRLNVEPDDLAVSIDEGSVDQEQLLVGLSLPQGSHQLLIESAGYEPEQRWFEVSANETLTLDVQLKPIVVAPSPQTRGSGDEVVGVLTDNKIEGDGNSAETESPPTEEVKPQLATGTIVLENFEKSTFDGWTVEGGAFGTAPLPTTDRPHMEALVPWQAEVGTFAGSNHLWHPSISAPEINHLTGKLTSEEFVLTHQYLNFFILGGSHPGRVEFRLRVGDTVVRSQTGFGTDIPLPVTWDISEWAGESATLEIIDDLEGGFIPYIGVDNISMSDLDASKAWELELRRKVENESIEWNGHKYWFPKWVLPASNQVQPTLDRLAALCGGKPVSISSDEEHEFFMNQIYGDTWLGLRGDGNGRFETPEGVMGSYFRWINGIPDEHRNGNVYCDNLGDWITYPPIDQYAYVAFEWGADTIEPHLFTEPEEQVEAANAIVDDVEHMLVRTTDRYVMVTKREELPDAPFDIVSIRFKPGYAMPRTVRSKFRKVSTITRLSLPETRDITLTLVTDLPELLSLHLSGRDFDGRVLARLPNHGKLRALGFSGVDLDKSVFRYFSGTTRLRSLGFRGMATEPATLAPFLDNQELRFLEFNAAGGIGERGIAMISRFPNLTNLVLWACGMTDRNARVLESLDQLRDIQLGANGEFRGGGLQYLAKNRHLRSLSLYATGANDDGIAYMPELPALRVLTFGRTRVTDLDGQLADKLPNLEDLGCHETLVGNDDLEQVKRFRYLRKLGVAESQITDQAARAFAQTRGGLVLD